MSNRSKKVVLSARVAPELKAGLEIYARAKKMKLVEALEDLIEVALQVTNVDCPLRDRSGKISKVSVSSLVSWLWSDDPIVYMLRTAYLSNFNADEEIVVIIGQVVLPRFAGDFDLFADTKLERAGMEVPKGVTLNLDLIKAEWATLLVYARFVIANKPLKVTYENFLTMYQAGEVK